MVLYTLMNVSLCYQDLLSLKFDQKIFHCFVFYPQWLPFTQILHHLSHLYITCHMFALPASLTTIPYYSYYLYHLWILCFTFKLPVSLTNHRSPFPHHLSDNIITMPMITTVSDNLLVPSLIYVTNLPYIIASLRKNTIDTRGIRHSPSLTSRKEVE